jgi:hypothetical protein
VNHDCHRADFRETHTCLPTSCKANPSNGLVADTKSHSNGWAWCPHNAFLYLKKTAKTGGGGGGGGGGKGVGGGRGCGWW